MKTRAYIERQVINDTDPSYNHDFYYIYANEGGLTELTFDQLKEIHGLIGKSILERESEASKS